MFDHVGLWVSDRAASERFYRTVLDALGIAPTSIGEQYAEWNDFALGQASDERPVTRRLHIGFAAPSRDAVHAFHEAGLAAGYREDGAPGPPRAAVPAFHEAGLPAGYRDDGAPGPRPEYGPDYYGGFLLDPDGNSAEAVHHDRVGDRDVIDHMWIRVADVWAAKAFYEAIAAWSGFRLASEVPGRAHFEGRGS